MDFYFDPMLISNKDGIDDSDEEFVSKWKKLRNLESRKKSILISQQTVNAIKEIAQRYRLSEKGAGMVSRIVRKIFFENIKEENISLEITRELMVDHNISHSISRDIINNILNAKLSKEENDIEEKIKIIETLVLQAIQQYPNLGEQLVTSSPIKLKLFPQPVRPSVKNWIEDYRQAMGIQKHGMMERGNYLFHGENSKKLTSGERKKLAEILRSLDEDVTLKVDPERQEIVFDQPEPSGINQEENSKTDNQEIIEPEETMNKSFERFASNYQEKNLQSIPNTKPEMPKSNIRFSSSHMMQSERASRNPVNQNPRQNIVPESPKAQYSQSAAPRIQRNFSNFQEPRVVSRYQSGAGKPFVDDDFSSPSSVEPKISGNTVDLRSQ